MEIQAWIEAVRRCEILPEDSVKKLCRKVKALVFEESNVQPVQAPVTVVGDIHGQFFDMLKMLEEGGEIPHTRYIIAGDFVDRGYHSVETITLLFLWKVKYPDSVVLLRGNHESRKISGLYGFYDEVNAKYGTPAVWREFNETFDYLPLAAIIEGSIFCVHGGLSPKAHTIDHIRSIERNIEIPQTGPFCDLMWSDPADKEVDTWKKNSRGAGWLFGKRVVDEFLSLNSCDIIVRAHQIAQEGYEKKFQGTLYTIWSAPNYCYRMNNKAAIMVIDSDLQHRFIVYGASPQSSKAEDYKNLLPYFL